VLIFFAEVNYQFWWTGTAVPTLSILCKNILGTFRFQWKNVPHNFPIVLQTEGPNVRSAKLHTVAASNSRNHMPCLLYYCLFAPHTNRYYS